MANKQETPEQRRERFQQQAEERLEAESTKLDIYVDQVNSLEKKNALIYIKFAAYQDTLKQVNDNHIKTFMNEGDREIMSSTSKWNDLVRNDNHKGFINRRNALKVKLALFLYCRENFIGWDFAPYHKRATDAKKERNEKLNLSINEILDYDTLSLIAFKEKIDEFMSMDAQKFINVFASLQIVTCEKYDQRAYIETQKFVPARSGFYLKAKYHTHQNDVRETFVVITNFLKKKRKPIASRIFSTRNA